MSIFGQSLRVVASTPITQRPTALCNDSTGRVWCMTDAGDIRRNGGNGAILALDPDDSSLRWNLITKHGLPYPWLFEASPGNHALYSCLPGCLIEAQWLSGEEIENPFAEEATFFGGVGLVGNNVLRKAMPGLSREQEEGAVALVTHSNSDGVLAVDLHIPMEGMTNSFHRACILLSWEPVNGFECHFARFLSKGTLLPDGRLIAMSGWGDFSLFDYRARSDEFYRLATDLRGYSNTDWSSLTANPMIYNDLSTWSVIPSGDRIFVGKAVDPRLRVSADGTLDTRIQIDDARRHQVARDTDERMIWLLSDLNLRNRWLHQPVRTPVPFSSGGVANAAGIWFDARSALWLVDAESFSVTAKLDWPSKAVARNGQPLSCTFRDDCFVTVRQSERVSGQYDLVVVQAA